MAQNKLENQIQEKLNLRTIQPSAQAWDRLDAMLTVAEAKKSKPASFWSFRTIGIAASFLIFPVIGLLIYLENSNSESIKEIPIQNNQIPIVKSEIKTQIEEIQNSKSIQVTEKKSPSKTYNSQSTTYNPQPLKVSIINQINPVAEVISKNEETPQPFISQEIIVSNQKNDITEVEIPVKKEISNTKIKVNATSLLSQVDGELEQKFRETKLEKIARNINTVKVALANRNKQ